MIGLQSIVAGILVAGSAVYAAWRLMTPRVRLSLVRRLAGIAPPLAGRWLSRQQRAAASGAASGCQSCAAGAAKQHVAK
ncbi:MAG TPA: hypothetical protein VMD03_00535 [Steroidobacteraceae bacterium]|nr:hypothetical protein [Steroidobacteraceae bacterium]